MSNLDKWNDWYKDLIPGNPSAFRYSDTETYRMAADFLADCELVEDWGCGAGGFQRYRPHGYRGIDGSYTPYADVIADLCVYRSEDADGILLRHVLEHDTNWPLILGNALASAKKKLCLVLFTPFSDGETKIIAQNLCYGVDVPDISFRQADIEDFFVGREYELQRRDTATGYGVEQVYRVVL